MHVAIVGPGRLGRSLHLLLGRAGVRTTLCSRSEPVPEAAEVVLLTVPDRAIAAAASAVPRGPTVLHCSGATGLDPLVGHVHAGSMHPLMTFPGPEVGLPDLTGVSAAIAGDPSALDAARWLCGELGLRPLPVPGDRRLYHAAAVLAGNFATVLMAEATRVLVEAGAPPDRAASALAPLALASIRGALPDPEAGLTGPAARGDTVTIEGHRAALAGLHDPALLELYDRLTARAWSLAGNTGSPPGVDQAEGDGPSRVPTSGT